MNRAHGVVILVLLTGLGIGATYFVQHISAPRIAAEQRLIDSRNLLDLLPPTATTISLWNSHWAWRALSCRAAHCWVATG